MRQVNVPSFTDPTMGVKVYEGFKGLDQSTDESQIDDSRSPYALNLISNTGGFPEKRVGWRTLCTLSGTGKVHGIWSFTGTTSSFFVVHHGTTLKKLVPTLSTDGDMTYTESTLLSGLTDQDSAGLLFGDKLYILTGGEYLYVSESAAGKVTDIAYVPTTTINAKPTGGGTTYEKVNLLTSKRINTFIADGSSKTFQLDVSSGVSTSGTTATVNGTAVTVSSTTAAGLVTLASAPAAPTVSGTANVEITFSKTTTGADTINKCTCMTTYGINTGSRVFLAGNPEHQAMEYYSGLSDPTYFPDQNFVTVGSGAFAIKSFLKFQGELLILKEDNRMEPTVWSQTAELDTDGVAVFPLRETATQLGCVNARCSHILLDDPLFLSPQGVYAPQYTANSAVLQRNMVLRSRFINRTIIQDDDLNDALATVWRGYYILCMGGHCYVADGNQNKSAAGYEWFYWDNIPATAFCPVADRLYFGTADGRFCTFNNDLKNEAGDILMRAYLDDGEAIKWEWRSKLDPLGEPSRYKTLDKRGNAVQLKAFTRSSCQIYIRTEKDFGVKVSDEVADVFDFEDIDFSRFTFSTLDNLTIGFSKKIKNFKFIQIILKGEEPSEGFGIYCAVLHYILGDYAKRRKTT